MGREGRPAPRKVCTHQRDERAGGRPVPRGTHWHAFGRHGQRRELFPTGDPDAAQGGERGARARDAEGACPWSPSDRYLLATTERASQGAVAGAARVQQDGGGVPHECVHRDTERSRAPEGGALPSEGAHHSRQERSRAPKGELQKPSSKSRALPSEGAHHTTVVARRRPRRRI